MNKSSEFYLQHRKVSSNISDEGINISRSDRENRNPHKAAVLWFTGLSGAGKSTLAKKTEKILFSHNLQTVFLDGDALRHGLCGDLGFTEADRTENIRRTAELAKIFFDNGALVLGAFISPKRSHRDFIRSLIPQGRFYEVFVKCNLQTCIQRDPKGLYKKAIAGEIADFTGISSPYEEPLSPELRLDTDRVEVDPLLEMILSRLKNDQIINFP